MSKSKEEILTKYTRGIGSWQRNSKTEYQILSAMQAYADQQIASLQLALETEQANLSREKKMFERVLGEKEEVIAGLKATLEQINKIAGKQYYNELAKVEEWNNDQFAGIEFPYKGKPDKPEIVRICLEALAQLNPIKGNNDKKE